MKHALYIIGEPGVGKTTLMSALRAPWFWHRHDHPFAHQHSAVDITVEGAMAMDPVLTMPESNTWAVELGAPRDTFGGTDALGMAVQPQAVDFLTGPCQPKLLLAEGDRLSNDGYFTAIREAGYQLYVYHLHGPRVAERRREQRGTKQDPTWVRGRRTKAEGLSLRWSAAVLDASLPVDVLVRSMMDPLSRVLRGEVRASDV